MRRSVAWVVLFYLAQCIICVSAFAGIDFSDYQELSCDTFIADAMDKDPEF